MGLPGSALPLPNLFLHSMILLLLAIGAGGLLYDSGGYSNATRVTEFHQLFAFVLAASVAARFLWALRRLGGPANPQWAVFTRSSSRLIYILLYALIAVQLLICLGQAASGHATPWSPEHCWIYVEYGVLAQGLLRTLAYFAK